MQNFLLGIYFFSSDEHTTINLSHFLASKIQEYEINPRNDIIAITSDNSSSITKAIHDEFPQTENIRCTAHSLQLAVQSVFKLGQKWLKSNR